MLLRLTNEEKSKIEQLYKDGVDYKEIAKIVSRAPQTICNHLDRVGLRKIERQTKRAEEPQETKNDTLSFDARRTPAQTPTPQPREIRNLPERGIRRGQIYFITKQPVVGHEFEAGRPAIIVSNNQINGGGIGFVEIVFLTTKEKKDMSTHVTIRSTGTKATALCEQTQTVSTLRLREYCGCCTEAEMAMIDNALAISLALNPEPVPVYSLAENVQPVEAENKDLDDYDAKFQAVVAERDMYKSLYDELIERILRK